MRLDDYCLRDVGLTRAMAEDEAGRSFLIGDLSDFQSDGIVRWLRNRGNSRL
jgi:hypothetical protein